MSGAPERPGLEESLTGQLDRALRLAAVWHDGQRRRVSDVPYIQHPMTVAWVLDRLGYDEDVVIAGLLHDVVEDTEATLDDVRSRFGDRVAALVEHCSEVKLDAEGRKRPWIDRKRDHLAALESAPPEARAIVLADKWHNLQSIAADLHDGRPVWDHFNADRGRVIEYYRATVDRLARDDDPRIVHLGRQCQILLDRIDSGSGPNG